MRSLVLACAVLALCAPSPAFAGGVVSAFYYPWFGDEVPAAGGYAHWAQAGHTPPSDIASNYYPVLGVYSSDSARVLGRQMDEMRRAGIDEVAVSWWGIGSPEDLKLQAVIAAARRAHLTVAPQIEPYAGRTVASVVADIVHLRTLGLSNFYIYRAFDLPAVDWADANDALRAAGATVYAQTGLVGEAVAGHFGGVYTYDIVNYGGGKLARYCMQAHRHGLLCAPSVGPGFDARRATGDPNVKLRRDGATYDSMWHAAIQSGADRITITSFNEWQEGTQIEPAAPPERLGAYRYGSYDGSWGLHGTAAESAYLLRTAYWANLFRAALRRCSV
jgi:glycoprotein endo-alpha-1,2-mannosidase